MSIRQVHLRQTNATLFTLDPISMRPAFPLLLLPCLLAGSAAFAADAKVTTFLRTYCIDCHGPKKQKGDFRVDELKLSATAADAENWQLVLDNLHLGEMPPEDEKQPKQAEVEPVTAWIEGELRRASLALGGHKDEVVLRRLNRLEYENTVEDLFDVRGDYAVGFPEDAVSGGFNNNGAALSLSAEQMSEYLRAADFILSRAIVTKPRPETRKVAFTLHDLNRESWESAAKNLQKRLAEFDQLTPNEQQRTREMQQSLNENPLYAFRYPALVNGRLVQPTPQMGPETDAVIPVNAAFGSHPSTQDFFRVREAGWYRLRITAYGFQTGGEPVRLKIETSSFREGFVPQLVAMLALPEGAPKDYDFKIYLEPNEQVRLGMTNGKRPAGGKGLLAIKERMAAIRRIEMEGPIVEQWPPRGHRVLFGKLEDVTQLNDSAVPQLLRDLAPKLFRRPVESAVVDEYIAFYQARRAEVPALDAYKLTVKAMMTSPLFLFHYEPAQKVDDFALANRLSYFLWRSMPDEELLALAAKGALSQPAERKKQTSRLLADAKAERFLKDFVGQWLQTTKVGEMQPDKGLYPEYDDELERAMVQETQLFIRELLVNDLSIANLIDSDWTMLNDRLARHYGIPGVTGNEFRKVPLDKTKTVRGGLLTQASILSITSNGTTTSPVVRGVWLLEHLLGTPAPPPPPDVPPIEPDIRGASTIQEQLAAHRDIAQCASCHKKIDPYGLALENFDVIGGWREKYRALIQEKGRPRAQLGDGKPVTAADALPKLGAFKNFTEFRALLKQNEHLVFHNVAEKLAVYALGRSVGFADRDDLEAIVKATRANGGGMRTMLTTFVQSPLFQRP
jgi:hypothetical protein